MIFLIKNGFLFFSIMLLTSSKIFEDITFNEARTYIDTKNDKWVTFYPNGVYFLGSLGSVSSKFSQGTYLIEDGSIYLKSFISVKDIQPILVSERSIKNENEREIFLKIPYRVGARFEHHLLITRVVLENKHGEIKEVILNKSKSYEEEVIKVQFEDLKTITLQTNRKIRSAKYKVLNPSSNFFELFFYPFSSSFQIYDNERLELKNGNDTVNFGEYHFKRTDKVIHESLKMPYVQLTK